MNDHEHADDVLNELQNQLNEADDQDRRHTTNVYGLYEAIHLEELLNNPGPLLRGLDQLLDEHSKAIRAHNEQSSGDACFPLGVAFRLTPDGHELQFLHDYDPADVLQDYDYLHQICSKHVTDDGSLNETGYRDLVGTALRTMVSLCAAPDPTYEPDIP